MSNTEYETLKEFIEKVSDGDNYDGFYRNATVEEVIEYAEKIMEEVEFMETYNYTKAAIFEFVSEGVAECPVEEFVKIGDLKKVEGDVYFDSVEGLIYIVNRAKKLEDDSFETSEGFVFSIVQEDEESE